MVEVRWSDCDPAGITFYPRFFEWMDLASHALARQMGISREDMLPPSLVGFPLVSAQAEFVAPARLEDRLEVRAWVTRVGRSSVGIRHEILRLGEQPTVLARGREERVHVSRDSSGAMLPRELTPEMQAVLATYGEASPGRGERLSGS